MSDRIVFGLALLVSVTVAAWADPPAPPANPQPPDGTRVDHADPQLCARVSDPQALPLEVRFFARDLASPPVGDFAIIALPDSQYYAQLYPAIFESQTRWIVENRKNLNIVFVSHLGDIVQVGSNDFEWQNASDAMSLLEDPALTELPHGIPHGLSVGNHDQVRTNHAGYPEDEGTSTTVNFNQYFPVDRYSERSYYGGHYGPNNDNSYQLFSVDGLDFIVIHHEFDDSYVTMLPLVLPWTDTLLKTYRNHRAILSTHSILCTGVSCPSTLWAEFSTQGQLTYDALKNNTNLFLMLCGHAGTPAQQPRRSDTWNGNTIHSMMANYQRFEDCPFHCGNGWLRILTFQPATDDIHVQTYSPWLDQFRSEPCLDGNPCHDFNLPYDMDGGVPFREIGSLSDVPSGSDVCVPWPGRQEDANYEWYVDVSNGSEWTESPRWGFDSGGSCTGDAACEDGNACTTDTCVGQTCVRSSVPDCCETDEDCDDDNYCTDDSCQSNLCSHSDNQNSCWDDDLCTENDVCAGGICAGTSMACDDGNACTTDACVDGLCENTLQPTPACCLGAGDSHCDDTNPCTEDTCDLDGDCLNTPDPTCCEHAADCDDGDACTVDACLRNGGAFRFDGVDDLALVGLVNPMGRPDGLKFRRFTVECWFKWDGAGEMAETSGWPYDADDFGVKAYPLVTKGARHRDSLTQYSINYFLGIDESGVLAADLEEHASGDSPGDNHAVRGTTPVSVGQWHHAAATYDGRCWQLFLDGLPQTDGSNCPHAIAAYETNSITGLGTALDVTGWVQGHFSGLIDEVRIWNRARTAQEIAAGMNTPIEQAPSLIGRWSLDAIDGVEFEDSTGNQHLGSVHEVSVEHFDVAAIGDPTCGHFVPQLVADLQWENYQELRLVWKGQPGAAYDVVSGLFSELRADGGTDSAQCLADDNAEPFLVDERPDPPSGEGHYYMIRSVGACAVSGWGTDSSDIDRFVAGGCF